MQLLKTGQIVQGKQGRYKILQTLSVSENQVVYRCQSEYGNVFRLNHYQADCPMTGEPRKRFLSLPQLPGILKPVDSNDNASMVFDVFPEVGNDIASHNIGVMELIRYVIPQLNAGLAQLHKYGLLIRDLDPSYIVFDSAANRAVFSQFCNLACINGGATATKADGNGLKPFYYPPEYQTMGWSIYSDYYAFGVSLLISLKGEKIFDGMTPQGILQSASKWNLPAVNRYELSVKSYNMLSLDQKLMYLIAGLTIPDPHQRWGYGEVRCWCTGQEIPLLQRGRKVAYQMSAPITVNGIRCWDYDQLGEELLKGGKASEQLLPAVTKHLLVQNRTLGESLNRILSDSNISKQGKVFYMGYTLYPGISGFWWNGRNMHTTAEIAAFSSSLNNGHQIVSQLLKDHCFTFLMQLRGVKSPEDQKQISFFNQLEQWEAEEKGKGAARFVMQMGPAREKKFLIQGRSYSSIKQFLMDYGKTAVQLKQISRQVLQDKVFQGWAWSMGFGKIAEEAARQTVSQKEEECFYSFLLLLEKMGTEEEKQLCRRIWLKYGPCAHITWVHEHLDLYHNTMDRDPEFLRQLRSPIWSERTSLEELNHNVLSMEMAYQNFVRKTETNAIKLHCGIPIENPKIIQPKDAKACFCCVQNQLEVTPDYLQQMGLSQQPGKIKSWCNNALQEAEQWLDEEINKINQVPGYAGNLHSNVENETIAGLTAWILIMLGIYFLNYQHSNYLIYIFLAGAMAFPAVGFLWCYSQKMVRSQKERQIDLMNQEKQVLQECKQDAADCSAKIISSLNNGKGFRLSLQSPLKAISSGSQIIQEEQKMNSTECKITYVISTVAAILMMISEEDISTFGAVSAMLYCAGISIYIGMNNQLTWKKGLLIFGYEFLVVFIMFNLLHDYFLVGAGISLYFLREFLFV